MSQVTKKMCTQDHVMYFIINILINNNVQILYQHTCSGINIPFRSHMIMQ